MQILPSAQGFMLVFRCNSGDSLNSSFAVFRPKPTSSGLEVEAEFYFQD